MAGAGVNGAVGPRDKPEDDGAGARDQWTCILNSSLYVLCITGLLLTIRPRDIFEIADFQGLVSLRPI